MSSSFLRRVSTAGIKALSSAPVRRLSSSIKDNPNNSKKNNRGNLFVPLTILGVGVATCATVGYFISDLFIIKVDGLPDPHNDPRTNPPCELPRLPPGSE
jgi:hypothetical protein